MSSSAQPGWYPAEGDPPGTERYWDGSAWTDGPRPIGGGTAPFGDAPETPQVPQDNPITGSGSSLGSAIGQQPSGGFEAPDTPTFGAPDMPSTGTPDMPAFGAPDMPSTGAPDMPTFGATPPQSPSGFGATGAAAGSLPGAAPGTPPAAGFPGAPPAGGGVNVVGVYPESSNATTALVLSIVGFFCGITAPFGAFMGYNEKKAIDEGRRDPSNRGMAVAALVIGGLITALMILSILFFVIVVFAASA